MVRVERRAGRLVDSRWTIAVAAAAAFLLRLPGLTRPARADEAGFVLVARSWHPMPDSLYGAYFVDRPPMLIALFKASDAIGGPLFIRLVGAVACAALVLAAAAVARLVADEHAARWTAVATAALSTNVLIDAVAVKGELLALPVLMASLGLSLVAVRDRSWRLALAAGLLAGLALGFKQNLVGGMVFAAVLFVGSWWAGRLTRPELLKLAGAAAAGAAVPVLATIGWALAEGVRLHTLWYAVYGFRFDASHVLAGDADFAPTIRAGLLVLAAVGAGMLLIIGGFLVHIRAEWRDDAPLTAAIAAHARRRPGRAGARRELLARLPVPAAARHRALRRAAGPPLHPARDRDAGGDHRRGGVDRALPGRLGGLQRQRAAGVRRARHRQPRSARSPTRPTRSWSSAAGPTCSSRASCPRRTPTCGACRCAPSTRTSPSSRRWSPAPTPPTWIVEWVPFQHWDADERAAGWPRWSRTATCARAPAAATGRSGCCAAWTGPPRSPPATGWTPSPRRLRHPRRNGPAGDLPGRSSWC